MDIKNGKKLVATIEARMTSKRLPGKVLLSVCEKTMLEHLILRLRRTEFIDDIVVATTTNSSDDPIVNLCEKINCKTFRGSEEDVLSRVLGAAKSVSADVICEITADCPLLDPQVTAQVIHTYFANQFDYVSNCQSRKTDDGSYFTYPIGMDTQVFSVECLEKSDKETDDVLDREHVSRYMIRNHNFSLCLVPAPPQLTWKGLALTLDEQMDFELIKTIYESLYPENAAFTLEDIIRFLKQNPDVAGLNAMIKRKEYPFEEIYL